jgi:hypothetical protein
VTVLRVTRLVMPGDPGRLGTRISVVCLQTFRRNNHVARCTSEYQLALTYSLCVANSRNETLLFIWLVVSPWYRTAKCQRV